MATYPPVSTDLKQKKMNTLESKGSNDTMHSNRIFVEEL